MNALECSFQIMQRRSTKTKKMSHHEIAPMKSGVEREKEVWGTQEEIER
jgi:hypothetical protein